MPPAVTMRALAGDHLGGRADDHARRRRPLWMSGLPALPMPTMRPSLMPMSRLDDAPVVEDERVGDDEVERPSARVAGADWPMPSRITLPPPNFDLVAVASSIVALDLDEQVGVREPDAVADGRAVEVGVLPAREAAGSCVRSPGTARARGPLEAPSRRASSRGRRPGVEAVDLARARERDERHDLLVAGLEADGRARGDVEPHAVGRGRGRSAAPCWPRRSGSASRPGSGGRRCWRRSAATVAAGPRWPRCRPRPGCTRRGSWR